MENLLEGIGELGAELLSSGAELLSSSASKMSDTANNFNSKMNEISNDLSNTLDKFWDKLYVAKEYPDAILPTQNHNTDAGWDLYAYENITIPVGETALVPIGCRITVDPGYWYSIYPRSSLGFKKSIIPANQSVFDASYTGNMDIKMVNLGKEDYTISKGDKFCQLVVHKVNQLKLTELSVSNLEDLHKENRGNKGWGSSGK
jgi:dUTP pyrophosphatase